MARQRDYRAEYRRRVALETERAARENRAPSRVRARGHGRDAARRLEINRRARISRLARATSDNQTLHRQESRDDIRAETKRAIRFARANGIPEADIEQMLRDKLHAQKLYRLGDKDYGKTRWAQRVQWLPAGFFYYQAGQ